MTNEYLQERNGDVYVGNTRVSLASIVLDYKDGRSPDKIHEDFPTVRLAAVYGALAYYLDHEHEVEQYLRDQREDWQRLRNEDEAARPEWYAVWRQRLAEARERAGLSPREQSELQADGDTLEQKAMESPAS